MENLQRRVHSFQAGDGLGTHHSFQTGDGLGTHRSWNFSFKPESYREHLIRKIDPIEIGNGMVEYQLDMSRDVLINTSLIMETPEVAVKTADILASLPDNFFHNYVSRIQLVVNDNVILEMDSPTFDTLSQILPIALSHREMYFRNIGNNGINNVFGRRHPKTGLSFMIPWGFSRYTPLPLFALENVSIRAVIKPIQELLRVVKRSKTGEDILGLYSEGDSVDLPDFPLPTMVVEYADLTDEELVIQPRQFEYQLEYFETFKPDMSLEINIASNDPWPIRGLFIMAQNNRAREIGNLSVYGTDEEDSYKGNGPISMINDIPAYFFSDQTSIWSGMSSRERPGYYFYPYTNLRENGTSGQAIDIQVTIPDWKDYTLHVISYGYRIWRIRNGEMLLF